MTQEKKGRKNKAEKGPRIPQNAVLVSSFLPTWPFSPLQFSRRNRSQKSDHSPSSHSTPAHEPGWTDPQEEKKKKKREREREREKKNHSAHQNQHKGSSAMADRSVTGTCIAAITDSVHVGWSKSAAGQTPGTACRCFQKSPLLPLPADCWPSAPKNRAWQRRVMLCPLRAPDTQEPPLHQKDRHCRPEPGSRPVLQVRPSSPRRRIPGARAPAPACFSAQWQKPCSARYLSMD